MSQKKNEQVPTFFDKCLQPFRVPCKHLKLFVNSCLPCKYVKLILNIWNYLLPFSKVTIYSSKFLTNIMFSINIKIIIMAGIPQFPSRVKYEQPLSFPLHFLILPTAISPKFEHRCSGGNYFEAPQTWRAEYVQTFELLCKCC